MSERASWTAVIEHRAGGAGRTHRTTATGVIRPEREEQAEVVLWAKYNEARLPVLRWLFSVPNAAKRRPKTISIMKSTGLKAGVPDLILPVANAEHIGLAIEMKIKGNTPTEAQHEWLDGLASLGWRTVVCWNAREAIDELTRYLNVPARLVHSLPARPEPIDVNADKGNRDGAL